MKLGGDRETVPAIGITHHPYPHAWLGQVILAPPPTPQLEGQLRELTKDSTRETFAVDRRGRPMLSLKLSDTGFSSLADAKRLCLRSTGAAWPGGFCGVP